MKPCRVLVVVFLITLLLPLSVMGAANDVLPVHSIDISGSGDTYEYAITVENTGIKTGYLVETFPEDISLVSSSLPDDSISVDGKKLMIAITGEGSFSFTIESRGEMTGDVTVGWKDLVDGDSGTFVYSIDSSGDAAGSAIQTGGATTATATVTPASPGFGTVIALISLAIAASTAFCICRRDDI